MLLGTPNILRELAFAADQNDDICDFLDEANAIIESEVDSDEKYNKVTEKLKLDILDVERYVSVNNCQPITNPRAFLRDSIPSDDGLLSNKIFGITRDERAGIFAYIDLHGWFIDPSCYKTWTRLDSNVSHVVHGTKTFKIDSHGQLVEDPAGKTGIKWLKANIDKIKFKSSESIRRDIKVKYLEQNRNRMFIQKYIVIPPFYRDKNTSTGSRVVGLSGVNKLYSDLIVASNALLATADFDFDASDAMNGRVQDIILNIYDWFCGNRNDSIKTDTGAGLSGKLGILRRAGMSKTSNFAARLVISAPELKVEKPEDMMVSLDKSAVPLAAVIAEFRDFVIYHVRHFFDNEFMGVETYPIQDADGTVKYVVPEDPQVMFSDEVIKREIERYLHGYNNRFVPVQIPIENSKEIYYMQFKGRGEHGTSNNPEAIYHRRLTWCDVFFIAATEAVRDKQVLITRFPIDSYTNQITTKVEISSTKETEPMYFGDKFYKFYPKIREEDIGKDTSNMFVDTMKLSNLYLAAMGGDYDGDTIICKGVYTTEANEELDAFQNSKANYLDFGCKPSKSSTADVIQSLYALTKVLSDTKLTTNIEYA